MPVNPSFVLNSLIESRVLKLVYFYTKVRKQKNHDFSSVGKAF